MARPSTLPPSGCSSANECPGTASFSTTNNDSPRCVMLRSGSVRASSMSALARPDRKSTRLNSSHMSISYAVFCLKKKILYRFKAIQAVEPKHLHLIDTLLLDHIFIQHVIPPVHEIAQLKATRTDCQNQRIPAPGF